MLFRSCVESCYEDFFSQYFSTKPKTILLYDLEDVVILGVRMFQSRVLSETSGVLSRELPPGAITASGKRRHHKYLIVFNS